MRLFINRVGTSVENSSHLETHLFQFYAKSEIKKLKIPYTSFTENGGWKSSENTTLKNICYE